MNKEQFLKVLDKSLKKLPSDERRDIIQDFEEHFVFGLEEGKTEEEISATLGSPNQIAKELPASYHLEKVEATATTGNIIRAVWAVVGLGFFNLVIVLGPFIALAAVAFAGWASGIAFIVSPLLVLINAIIYPETFALFDLFFSLMLSGLGLFIAIGMFVATRKLIDGFIRYLQFNVKLVKGGLKHD
ncbi:HAAS signaling domain-containing protein [Virgibacillus sp. FSP13]